MQIYCLWVLIPQFATVSTSKKLGLCSSRSQKVRIGMSLLRFFANRFVEMKWIERFCISGFRILSDVELDLHESFAFSSSFVSWLPYSTVSLFPRSASFSFSYLTSFCPSLGLYFRLDFYVMNSFFFG